MEEKNKVLEGAVQMLVAENKELKSRNGVQLGKCWLRNKELEERNMLLERIIRLKFGKMDMDINEGMIIGCDLCETKRLRQAFEVGGFCEDCEEEGLGTSQFAQRWVCCVGCQTRICDYNEEPPHKDNRDEAVCDECWKEVVKKPKKKKIIKKIKEEKFLCDCGEEIDDENRCDDCGFCCDPSKAHACCECEHCPCCGTDCGHCHMGKECCCAVAAHRRRIASWCEK